MDRTKFWTPQTAAWALAVAGAFVVFVSGGCGIIRGAIRSIQESRRPADPPLPRPEVPAQPPPP